MSTPETVTFTKVVPIADADGKPIRIGSVLRHTIDGERGVVTRIVRAGMMGTCFDAVGDLNISTGLGSTRVSNQYDKWRHIPQDDQTYQERYISWRHTPFNDDLSALLHGESLSMETRIAMGGIMSLLPSSAVDWGYGPHPDCLEQVLKFMAEHLTSIAKQ